MYPGKLCVIFQKHSVISLPGRLVLGRNLYLWMHFFTRTFRIFKHKFKNTRKTPQAQNSTPYFCCEKKACQTLLKIILQTFTLSPLPNLKLNASHSQTVQIFYCACTKKQTIFGATDFADFSKTQLPFSLYLLLYADVFQRGAI